MRHWPEHLGRVHLAETDSTNAEAARRAAAGAGGPLWVLADVQTAGRGRRGRAWTAPKGNFNGSLLLRPQGAPSDVALRSFVAALALRDAFEAVTGRGRDFTLKWPNDVLAKGQKIAGILLESASAPGGVDHLVVGIGVNLIASPPQSALEPQAWPVTNLASVSGVRVSPGEFLDVLGPAFDHWERRLSAQGFDPIREEWLGHAARLGEVITAKTGRESVTGTFDTLDETGALVLNTATGPQKIAAAEIFFA